MASSLVEITSEPSQPDLLTAMATLPGSLSASERWALVRRLLRHWDLTRRLRAYSSFQEGGLLSDYARDLEIRLDPTDEDLVEIWDGREWKRGPLFEDWYFQTLRREKIRRFRSAMALRQPDRVVADNGYLPGCVFECETCGQQSPTLEALRGCHGSILLKPRRITGGHRSGMKSSPVKARPGCLPCDPAERVCHGEVRSRIHNHVSHGESDGLAHAETAIDILEEGEICVPPARPHWSHGLPGNIFGEGTSTMQNPVSPGTTPGGRFDSLAHEHARSILLQGGRFSSDGTAIFPESVFECGTWGPQFPQAHGGHSPNHLELTPIVGGDGSGLKSSAVKAIPHGSLEYDVPTMWNISGEGTSTMHNHISRGTSPISEFDGIAHADIAIDIPEEGGSCVHSSDHTRPVRGYSRLAILGDLLFDVNVQGAFALVAFKTSDASSPARDALLYLLVFVYVFGFLSALGGKVFRSSKMQMSGSAATVLGFLLTMVLRLL